MHYTAYQKFKKSTQIIGDPSQISAANFFSNSAATLAYPASHHKQRALTASLVQNVLVKCALPIALVDNVHFRSFLHDLDPSFNSPCRQTVTYTIIPQLLEAKREVVKNVLKSQLDAALTVDIWTDRRAHSFIGVTVHAFDTSTGELITKLLKFKSFKGSHTGQHIAESIEATIAENDLQSKVHYIVTDNASNMRKAMSVMFASSHDSASEHEGLESAEHNDDEDDLDDGTLYCDIEDNDVASVMEGLGERLPCFAHSLQLVVHDGLKKVGNGARLAIAKCSKLASIVHQSSLFCEAFQEVFGQRSVPAVNDTRWNSTYRHLKAIIQLDGGKLADVLKKSSQGNLVLSAKEQLHLRELVDILEPFAEATDLSQGDKDITISCVVPIVVSLNRILTERASTVKFMGALVRELHSSLYQRFHGYVTHCVMFYILISFIVFMQAYHVYKNSEISESLLLFILVRILNISEIGGNFWY